MSFTAPCDSIVAAIRAKAKEPMSTDGMITIADSLEKELAKEREEWRNRLKDAHEVGQGFLNTLREVLNGLCYMQHMINVKK